MKRADEKIKLVKYIAKRGISTFIIVVIAVYITIYIANMGGYVDEIVKSETYLRISMEVRNNPAYSHLTSGEMEELIDKLYEQEVKRLGLDKPFLYRSFIYLKNALTLELGRAQYLTSDSGSRNVRNIILERLPATVLLFTTANLIIFVIGLFGGLFLSRRYGSKLDKVIVTLSPLSSIPGWFYGIFLILIFASWFHLLPYGGFVDAPPPKDPLNYALSVMKHMILPVISWLISYSLIETYVRRTFFLMFSNEDYVEMAKAKGVPPRMIERRYILRPTLPPIITSFALTLISSWMGAIITERVFNWPGIGSLFYMAASIFDSPVIIGGVVIYAYLLGLTVFVLDVIYALIDPRIRVRGA
ncbi:ABC transporter permease [Candidatus Bathyarchaeota archaeon]|nr:MAG: ABC transporter permease [Candidatus Bathyarchaeota archaeon]